MGAQRGVAPAADLLRCNTHDGQWTHLPSVILLCLPRSLMLPRYFTSWLVDCSSPNKQTKIYEEYGENKRPVVICVRKEMANCSFQFAMFIFLYVLGKWRLQCLCD